MPEVWVLKVGFKSDNPMFVEIFYDSQAEAYAAFEGIKMITPETRWISLLGKNGEDVNIIYTLDVTQIVYVLCWKED